MLYSTGVEQELPANQIEETTEIGSTIIRGVLFLPRSSDASIPRFLLGISGCKVLDLTRGANNVRAMAPGVYFVMGPETGDRSLPSARWLSPGRREQSQK